MKKTYTTAEAADILGVNIKCFNAWVFEKFITSSVPQKKKGASHVWTKEDIYVVAFLKHLIARDYYRRTAAMITKLFAEIFYMRAAKTPIDKLRFFVYHITKDGQFLSALGDKKILGMVLAPLDDIVSSELYNLTNIFEDLLFEEEEAGGKKD